MKLNTLIIIINFYYIFAGEFIDIKKLFLIEKYFVILDTGLYLYDSDFLNCASIYEFKDEYKEANNKIILKGFHYKSKAYIICLVNEYVFIYNENTYTILNYKIEQINTFKDCYYDMMPYKVENSYLGFIVVLNKDENILFFYYYNFSIKEGINAQKALPFMGMNIQNKMIRCQINSDFTFFICFYYSKINNENIFSSTMFYINNMNLIKGNTLAIDKPVNAIKQIKIEASFDDNYFVCYSNNTSPICFINDESYNFKEIGCNHGVGWDQNYKVFYFSETKDFILTSRYWLSSTIFNNFNKSLLVCSKNIFSYQNNVHSLIYQNGYRVVNYTDFQDRSICRDISILGNDKQSEYIKKSKNSIENSVNKEELIANLNDFIKNKIDLNYIDENKELIIPKDNDTTITFTSTNIQKNNEETNSNTSTINLGKCEDTLKKVYNISNESNLYILKIDKEQKDFKIPKIEYEVFYPLNDGEMEILNLSYCKGSDIEISIPIEINDTIDKYDPKSGYYNDICYKATSDFNTDITLNDRRNEFIKYNMSLCEENCELTSYDNIKKRAKCSCDVKTSISLDNIQFDRKNLMKNFLDIKKITNIEIVKCYKIVFKKNNINYNFGLFFFFFMFILYFTCLTVFYCKSLKKLIDEIIKIIEAKNKKNDLNKNYIKNNKIDKIY